MNGQDIENAAAMLFEAERTRQQCGLLSLGWPDLNMDDAYAVQSAFVKRKLAEGRKSIGWKIGLTSRAMQQALNIETPDSGILLDDMLFADQATIPADRFIQPRIEAEIAFILAEDLNGGNITRQDVLDATQAVAPALEILDTRILRQDPETGKQRIVTDTISDNAANAGLVLGGQRHGPSDFDLRRIGCILKRNDVVEETGLGAGVLDDPVMGIVWLAERLALYGQHMKAGEIILSGSFIRPVEAPPGSRFSADFGDFGSVTISFA